MSKFFDKTMLKFLLVGIINTLVGTGTMFLLYNFAHCSYWVSSAANYLLGGIVSFLLNKYFTFQNKSWSWAQVGKFAATVAVCYLLSYGVAKQAVLYVMSGHTLRMQENVAMLAGMCLYTGLNYLGQRFFAFRQ